MTMDIAVIKARLVKTLQTKRAADAQRLQYFESFEQPVREIMKNVDELMQAAADEVALSRVLVSSSASAPMNSEDVILKLAYDLSNGSRVVHHYDFIFTIRYGAVYFSGHDYGQSQPEALFAQVADVIASKIGVKNFEMKI